MKLGLGFSLQSPRGGEETSAPALPSSSAKPIQKKMILEPSSTITWRRAGIKRKDPLNLRNKNPQSCSLEKADGPEGHPPPTATFLQPPPAALQESPWPSAGEAATSTPV